MKKKTYLEFFNFFEIFRGAFPPLAPYGAAPDCRHGLHLKLYQTPTLLID